MKFWESFKVADKTCYCARLGPLQIWLLRDRHELKLFDSRLSEEEIINQEWENISIPLEICEKPDTENWNRWILSPEDAAIKFTPIMPDRPIVVRPLSSIQILPGNKTMFYVSIPVWIRISTDKDQVLTEIPAVNLSNTWFGEPLTGELCYAIKSKAITNFEMRKVKNYTAICPILIENYSPRNFIFRRISIHTEFLSVFKGVKHLWTNEIEVRIEGDDQKSFIDFSDSAPDIEKIGEQLSASREVPSKKLYRKMFADLPFIKG